MYIYFAEHRGRYVSRKTDTLQHSSGYHSSGKNKRGGGRFPKGPRRESKQSGPGFAKVKISYGCVQWCIQGVLEKHMHPYC